MRQRCHDLALYGNRMRADLSIKCLAEHDDIVGAFLERWLGLVVVAAIEPELHLINEVEAAPVDNRMFHEMIFRSKENGGGKDSLKSCFHSSVLGAILSKSKVVEELGWILEVNHPVVLLQRECGEPYWNQSVLSISSTEAGVGGDFEEEAAVSASVNELVGGRPAQREPTKHKGSGVVSDYLPSIFPLLADHLDGLEFPDSLLSDTNLWED